MLIVIDVPAGHPMANISKCSANPTQNEVLLAEGTKYNFYNKMTYGDFVIVQARAEKWEG